MTSRSWAVRTTVLGTGLLLALGTAGAASAAGSLPVPIGPNQYYVGLVNGVSSGAVVRTDCPATGPSAQTGHPLGGQTAMVSLYDGVTTTWGFTGSVAHSVRVTIGGTASAGTPAVIGTTTDYYVALPVPTTLTVPCSGPGTATFTALPTSTPAKNATVPLTFQPRP